LIRKPQVLVSASLESKSPSLHCFEFEADTLFTRQLLA